MFTTYGSVRGQCGHAHQNRTTAERCLAKDHEGCRAQGGYSDRMVCRVTDAGYLETLDGETVWPSHGRSTGAVVAECKVRAGAS